MKTKLKRKEKDDLFGVGSGVTLTRDQWLALAYLIFKSISGKTWRFICPACKGVQTPKDFKDSGQDIQQVYQACLKRGATLKRVHEEKLEKRKKDCDWVAYGLFRGPWIISAHDKEKGEDYEVAVFGFEGTTQALIDRAKAETETLLKEAKSKETKE